MAVGKRVEVDRRRRGSGGKGSWVAIDGRAEVEVEVERWGETRRKAAG